MVQWMDKVDISLLNIMKEVNTLEEFEKERAVFQVCLNCILQCKVIM
jgi:nesprin-1